MQYHSRQISDEGLEDIIHRLSGYSAVSFYDHGSIPCDHFTPEFEALADALAMFPMRFYRIQASENPSALDWVKVCYVPTVLLFKDGEIIKRWEGPYTREALENRVREELRRRA